MVPSRRQSAGPTRHAPGQRRSGSSTAEAQGNGIGRTIGLVRNMDCLC
jgi:hypothetical protein